MQEMPKHVHILHYSVGCLMPVDDGCCSSFTSCFVFLVFSTHSQCSEVPGLHVYYISFSFTSDVSFYKQRKKHVDKITSSERQRTDDRPVQKS